MRKQLTFIFALTLLLGNLLQANAHYKTGKGVSADAKFAYSLRAEKGSEKFVLSFDNLTNHAVKIKIYNVDHQLVFSETQKHTQAMRKRYDLSNLAIGTYTVKVESGSYEFSETIEIGQATKTEGFDVVIVPDAHHDRKLRVGFAHATADVTVEIEDDLGNLVHSEVFREVENANQLFNMEFLTPGTYVVTVSSNGQKVIETFEVN
ncbi:MAG: T9SS type A sorting domain-containing protein [Flammeovirgaceae bacterium]